MSPDEAEILTEAIEIDFIQLVDAMDEMWERAYPSGNEGQQALYDYYIAFLNYLVIEYFAIEWPWVDANDYYDTILSAHEAMEPCWSDTVQEVTDMMEEQIEQAMAKFDLLDAAGYIFWF